MSSKRTRFRRKNFYWIIQVLVWSLYTSAHILGRALSSGIRENDILYFVLEGGLLFGITHYSRYAIKKLRWLDLTMYQIIPRILLSVILLGPFTYFFRLIITLPLGLFVPEEDLGLQQILGISIIFSLIYFVWMVLYFAYQYFMQYNHSLRQEAEIKEIELNNLKSQLNPHFIFNSLNSIRALVDENPKNSKKAITQLSNILRKSLATDKQRLTTINDEITLVRDYLGLEMIRYEERLKVNWNLDEEAGFCLVPPLMIQTLAENAIKHGIARLKQGGMLSIRTYFSGELVIVEIINSGQISMDLSKGRSGVGLENTRRRLRVIYGESAGVSIENNSSSTVLTKLFLPKRETL